MLKLTLFRHECCGQNTPGICRHLKSNWKYMLCSLFYALKSKQLPCEIYIYRNLLLKWETRNFFSSLLFEPPTYGLLTIKSKVFRGGRKKLITKNKGYKGLWQANHLPVFTKRRQFSFCLTYIFFLPFTTSRQNSTKSISWKISKLQYCQTNHIRED